jgi:hypothetical protein
MIFPSFWGQVLFFASTHASTHTNTTYKAKPGPADPKKSKKQDLTPFYSFITSGQYFGRLLYFR